MDYLCVVSISCASLSRLRQAEKEKGKLWGKSFLTFLFFFLFIQNHAHIYTEREREREREKRSETRVLSRYITRESVRV
jgi:hypothetical protein